MTVHVMNDAERIAYLEAQVAKLTKTAQSPYRMKVSDKGALSVYGIRRQFPITFYSSEWEQILSLKDEIEEYLIEHAGKLSRKNEQEQD